MRDPNRIMPMLDLLRQVWEANPDWRLGQLVSNAIPGRDPFYVEDDEMRRALRGLVGTTGVGALAAALQPEEGP